MLIRKKPIYIIANAVIFPNRISGGDINFLELGKIWQKWGHPIYVVTTEEGRKMCLTHGFKANFVLLPSPSPKHFGIFWTYVARTLLGPLIFLKYARPNSIIFSSSDLTPDITPAWVAKVKYPSTVWAISPNMIFSNPFKGYTKAFTPGFKFPSFSELLHFIAQQTSIILTRVFADKIIAISHQMGDFFTKQKSFPKSKVVYTNYGVHARKLEKLAPLKRNQYEACFMARFHPQKGIFDLLKIWKKVTAVLPKARLVVMGGGQKKITEKFLKKINDYRLLKNIKLLGFRFGDERFRIVKSSQVFLFPSFFEGNPITVLEIMACHVPIVAYALPVFLKEYSNKGMMVVPVGNTQKFANQVIKLLKNPSLREVCVKNNSQIVANYDWKKVARLILNSFSL